MKSFIVKDKQGRFGVLTTKAMPQRMTEILAGVKCLDDGKVHKDKDGTGFPEDTSNIQTVAFVKKGYFVVGVRGADFEAMYGAIRAGSAIKH